MLQIIDPTGAQLGLWQPKNHIGAGNRQHRRRECAGTNCSPKMRKRPKPSMRALFGWEYIADENGYIMILNRGRNNGAMMQMDESFGEMPFGLAALLYSRRYRRRQSRKPGN